MHTFSCIRGRFPAEARLLAASSPESEDGPGVEWDSGTALNDNRQEDVMYIWIFLCISGIDFSFDFFLNKRAWAVGTLCVGQLFKIQENLT